MAPIFAQKCGFVNPRQHKAHGKLAWVSSCSRTHQFWSMLRGGLQDTQILKLMSNTSYLLFRMSTRNTKQWIHRFVLQKIQVLTLHLLQKMHFNLWKKLMQLLVIIIKVPIFSQLTILQAKLSSTLTLETFSRLHHNLSPLLSAINSHHQMKQIKMLMFLLPLIWQQILIFWKYWQSRLAKKRKRVHKRLRYVLTIMFSFCEACIFFWLIVFWSFFF